MNRAALLCVAACLIPGVARAADRPDLRITYAVDAPSPFLAGAQFSTGARVTNMGKARASASFTRYYLSLDKRADRRDVVLATRRASRLRPGRTSYRGVRVQVPRDTGTGSYWMLVCVDATRRVRESNERNNCVTTIFPIDVVPFP
jgi:CARDB